MTRSIFPMSMEEILNKTTTIMRIIRATSVRIHFYFQFLCQSFLFAAQTASFPLPLLFILLSLSPHLNFALLLWNFSNFRWRKTITKKKWKYGRECIHYFLCAIEDKLLLLSMLLLLLLWLHFPHSFRTFSFIQQIIYCYVVNPTFVERERERDKKSDKSRDGQILESKLVFASWLQMKQQSKSNDKVKNA